MKKIISKPHVATADADADAERRISNLDEPTLKVLKDIVKSKSLLKHRYVLEKVYRYVLQSKENDRRWANKCRELNAQIAANSAKVQAALLLSEEDKATIDTLKQELDKSWKMAEEACHNELIAKETTQSLKQEIARMHEENARQETAEGSMNPKRLLKLNQELTIENERLQNEIGKLSKQNSDGLEHREKMECEIDELKEQNEQLNRESQLSKMKYEKEASKRINAEKEFSIVKEEFNSRESHLKELEQSERKNRLSAERSQKQLEEKTRELEKTEKELENCTVMMNTVQREFEIQVINLRESTADIKYKSKELASKEEKISALRKEVYNLKKQNQATLEKLSALRSHGSETDILNLKSEHEALLRQNDQWQSQCEELEKEIAEMREEKDKMAQAVIQSITDVQNLESQLLTQEHLRRSLNTQIRGLEDEAKVQTRTMNHLQTERTRIAIEAGELQTKVYNLQEELKAQECLNYRKQLSDADKKMMEIQKALEDSRKERINYEKQCKHALDDVADMRVKIQSQTQKIFYLKEQMIQQDVFLKRTFETLDLSYQDRHHVASELKTRSEEHNFAIQEKKRLEDKNEALNREIMKMTKEQDVIRKQLDKVAMDNRVVETQLLRREDEVKLLMEKLEVQQRTLDRGELEYRELVQDTKLLKVHAKTLAREKGLLVRKVSVTDDLRKELLHSQRVLITEQTRAKALEEEMKNPLNVHRWRILQGSDPERYELLQKVHTLQKSLINKSEEVVKQTVQLKEKDRLLEEMKESMSRQPKEEIVKKLQICVAKLNEKAKTMKTLEAQLTMYEAYITDYQNEIERLTKELELQKYSPHTEEGSPTTTRMTKKSKQLGNSLNSRSLPKNTKRKYRNRGFKIQ